MLFVIFGSVNLVLVLVIFILNRKMDNVIGSSSSNNKVRLTAAKNSSFMQ
jgi:hypothetical protein